VKKEQTMANHNLTVMVPGPATQRIPRPPRPLRELWLLAVARFTPPTQAPAPAGRDAAKEAAELRAQAYALPSSEAGFKADLLAAADRHVRLHRPG
jgi:hypothetical protein